MTFPMPASAVVTNIRPVSPRNSDSSKLVDSLSRRTSPGELGHRDILDRV